MKTKMVRVDTKTIRTLKRFAKEQSSPGRKVTIGGVIAQLVEDSVK